MATWVLWGVINCQVGGATPALHQAGAAENVHIIFLV